MIGLLILAALIFFAGYTVGEWVEEHRRDKEWWAERPELSDD